MAFDVVEVKRRFSLGTGKECLFTLLVPNAKTPVLSVGPVLSCLESHYFPQLLAT